MIGVVFRFILNGHQHEFASIGKSDDALNSSIQFKPNSHFKKLKLNSLYDTLLQTLKIKKAKFVNFANF